MRDFRSKTIKGWMSKCEDDGIQMVDADIRVRMTSDDIGQSLSLTVIFNDEECFQVGIPLEPVSDIVAVVNDRNRGKGGKHR